MEKRVKITIKGTQKPLHEQEIASEFVTYGLLARYGDKYRISYDESDMFGTEGVNTAFVVEGEKLSMERTGKTNSRMLFVPGKKTESMYCTEMGTFLMGIISRYARADINDDGGSISIGYGVELEHQHIGYNTFDVTVEQA